MNKPTTVYEDNQAALGIIATGHITSRVKYMAVPISIIHEEITSGNAKGEKISGKLNPADIGTKPLPALDLHRISRHLRRQRYYPTLDSKHG